MNYLNPFELVGAAIGGAAKIVHDAPSDVMKGWDEIWEEPPVETEPKPATKPTPEQIKAKIEELSKMLPDEPAD